MRVFLQSLDEKVWQAVEIGYFNSRALNALFSAVTNEEFKKISSIETTKEALTILQKTYERTKGVKDSKLQRLTVTPQTRYLDL